MAVKITPYGPVSVPDQTPETIKRDVETIFERPKSWVPTDYRGGGGSKPSPQPTPQPDTPKPEITSGPVTSAPTQQDLLRVTSTTVPPRQVPGVVSTDYTPMEKQIAISNVYYSSKPGWKPKDNEDAVVIYTKKGGRLTGETSRPEYYDLSDYKGARVDRRKLTEYIKENPPTEVTVQAPTTRYIEPDRNKYLEPASLQPATAGEKVRGFIRQKVGVTLPSGQQTYEKLFLEEPTYEPPKPFKEVPEAILRTSTIVPGLTRKGLDIILPEKERIATVQDKAVLTAPSQFERVQGFVRKNVGVTIPSPRGAYLKLSGGEEDLRPVTPTRIVKEIVPAGIEFGQWFTPVYGSLLVGSLGVKGVTDIATGITEKDPQKITVGAFETAPALILGGSSITSSLLRKRITPFPRGEPIVKRVDMVREPVKIGDKTFTPVSIIADVKVPAQYATQTSMLGRILRRQPEVIQLSPQVNYRVTGEFLTTNQKSLGFLARSRVGRADPSIYLGLGRAGKPLSKSITDIDKYILSQMFKTQGMPVPFTQSQLSSLIPERSLTQRLFTYNIKTGRVSRFAKRLSPDFGLGISTKPAQTKLPNVSKFIFAGKSGKSPFPRRAGSVQRGRGIQIKETPKGDVVEIIDIGTGKISKASQKTISSQIASTIPKPKTNLIKLEKAIEANQLPKVRVAPLDVRSQQIEITAPSSVLKTDLGVEEITLSNVISIPKTKAITSSTQSDISKSKGTIKSLGVNTQAAENFVEGVDTTLAQRVSQGQKLSLRQRLGLKTKTITRPVDVIITTTPITIPKRVRLKKNPFKFDPNLDDEKKKLPGRRATRRNEFVPQVRRRGKFFSLKAQPTQKAAQRVGESFAKQTLGASFRIKGPRGGFIATTPGKGFRLARKDPTIVVQRKTARFGSIGEQAEIRRIKLGGFGF